MLSPSFGYRLLGPIVALALVMFAPAVMAHPGHVGYGEGIAAGFLHPFTGIDHLLALAAIGLWSVKQASPAYKWTPVMGAVGMILGAAMAWTGMSLFGVETGIATSVLVAGVLVAAFAKVPAVVGGTVVVAMLLFHGFAHGSEMQPGAPVMMYAGGFVLASMAIISLGRLSGKALTHHGGLYRMVGALVALAGGVLVLG